MQRRSWRAAVGGGLLVFAATPCAVAQTPTLETIYYFQGEIDGKRPVGLTTGSDGVLYGVTSQGGTGTACRDGCGVVFSLTPPASASGAWTETVLYNFRGGRDGNSPVGLAANGSGVLYGTTFGGGDSGAGTVFSLTPPASSGGEWHKSVVYSFTGLPDGSGPIGGVSIDGGLIYGTTKFGGAAGPDCAGGCGTVFSLTPPDSRGGAWAETVLYRFSGGSAGSVYSLTPPSSVGQPWTYSVMHAFDKGDGADPDSLVLTSGAIYGTTAYKGSGAAAGTVFSLQP